MVLGPLSNYKKVTLNFISFLHCVSLRYNHVRQVHFESRRKNDRTIWYPTDALLVIHVELIRLSMPRLALLSFWIFIVSWLSCCAQFGKKIYFCHITFYFNCFLHWLLNATCKLFLREMFIMFLSLHQPVTKNQILKFFAYFFVVVANQKKKRQASLFFFQIVTTTKK